MQYEAKDLLAFVGNESPQQSEQSHYCLIIEYFDTTELTEKALIRLIRVIIMGLHCLHVAYGTFYHVYYIMFVQICNLMTVALYIYRC